MESEWNSAPIRKKTPSNKQQNQRRVFISNLSHSPDLEQRIRDLFSQSAILIQSIEIGFPKHIQIQLQKQNGNNSVVPNGSSCFALVGCNTENAIKCLNGILFDGKRLVVQLERTKISNSNKGSNSHNQKKKMTKFGGGWSKPTPQYSSNPNPKQQPSKAVIDEHKSAMSNTPVEQNTGRIGTNVSNINDPIEALTKEIGDFISTEIKEQTENEGDNDPITTAIASTATAMAFLSTRLDTLDNNGEEGIQKIVQNDAAVIGSKKKEDDTDAISTFHSKIKNVSLSHLMSEYGEYDPDFDKKVIRPTESVPVQSNSTITKKKKDINTSQKLEQSTATNDSYNSMLAPNNGKAPIHIELVSFGFKYSAPAEAREGWSHSNPLPPIDCRDLPRAPHYVAKLSGLSFKVKQALLRECDDSSSKSVAENWEEGDVDGMTENSPQERQKSSSKLSNQLHIKAEEVASKVITATKEAIDDGGHGYAFHLSALIPIGSEYGRHRSVVLCELAAQSIRNKLRKNEGNLISQPVSVGTRHRDVDRNHRDDKAFGLDLRRQHDIEVKQKKKQEWLESRW